jgi:hypothetical protein
MRTAVALVVAAAAELAAAQSASPSAFDLQSAAVRDANRAAADWLAKRQPGTEDSKGLCVALVSSLNPELARGTPWALALAGQLYESGACLKRDWSRAERLLLKAAGSDYVMAKYSLAAGYATPAAGPDLATALWWAHEAKLTLPTDCIVKGYGDGKSADPFLAEIQQWVASRLRDCAYVTALQGALAAELFSPLAPRHSGQPAFAAVTYFPDGGRLVVEVRSGGGSTEQREWKLADTATEVRNDSLLDRIQLASRKAAQRLPAPPGLAGNLGWTWQAGFGAPPVAEGGGAAR